MRFELIPVQVTQTPNVTPPSAQVRIILRQLPVKLFQKTTQESFLAELGQHLALSIPQRNATAPSNSFRLEQSDADQHTLDILYFFQADLEHFSHVELVLSGQGNPAFAPVPVEGGD